MFKTLPKFRFKSRKKTKQNQEKSSDHSKGDIAKEDSEKEDSATVLAKSPSSSSSALSQSSSNVLHGTASVLSENVSSTNSSISVRSTAPEDTKIKAEDLYDVFKRKHADEDRIFRSEFESIASYVKGTDRNFKFARAAVNRDKNRYKNIVTCDESRVILKPSEGVVGSEYINASFMDGYNNPKKFIATQGPKENTINDFWRMIWEQKVYVIVMVTELREVGKFSSRVNSFYSLPKQQKCDQYWPDNGHTTYGDVRVELKAVYAYGGFTKRVLIVTHKKERGQPSRTVSQFQYRAWPDHGVPKTTSEMFRFRLRSLETQPRGSEGGPIVVHCSAGVGRTGTYIALDYLLQELRAKGEIDVSSLVINMRMKRTDMVQSLDQYVFLHKLIKEHYMFGVTDVQATEFMDVYERMKVINPKTKKSGFEAQFDLLSKCEPSSARIGAGKLPENSSKIRDEEVVTYEHSKVFMRIRGTEKNSPFYNGSNMEAYDVNSGIIAAQDPFSDMLKDYWRVVMDNGVTCLVMCCPLRVIPEEEEYEDSEEEYWDACTKFWPAGDSLSVGDIKVNFVTSVKHSRFTEITLNVVEDHMTRKVTLVRCYGWEDADTPPTKVLESLKDIVAFVCDHLKKKENNQKMRVMVHCSDGASRTGIVCALINIQERLRREHRVDVFRAVKDLRDCRPGMVRTKEQFRVLYSLTKSIVATRLQAMATRDESDDRDDDDDGDD